ncbi:hypothetical protein DFH06DRAFT_45360 [Mycena polygramma]|nr:hypothetical protein DFH06DRAFT_45360 [Mycena polygramma]
MTFFLPPFYISTQIPHGFTAILKLEAPPGHWNVYSVIGVVTTTSSPSPTTSGNLACKFRIVDPSNRDESFLVNCFTEKYANLLPTASEGSVIVLHNTTMHGGKIVANGYRDKLQWAVYDPTTGQLGHGDVGGAPESERLANGRGVDFPPFYTGTDAVLSYCKALNGWWAKPVAPRSTLTRAPRREHKLISETRIDEYFDCTIQVLHGQFGKTLRLQVTDGTIVAGGEPFEHSACPSSLARRTLNIEMWDEAAEEGLTMVPGEYYHLRNVRLIQSKDGYKEAKLVEPKIIKIEPDTGANLPTYRALLERLKPFYPETV